MSMLEKLKSMITIFFSILIPTAVIWLLVTLMWTKGCQAEYSHYKSKFVGLNRVVTLYAGDGKVIASWSGDLYVEDKGGTVRFVKPDGKAVTLSGTFVVEEK
jgi:hypothetical protein